MPKPRTSSVVLYHGDDIERIAELRRTAERASRLAQAEGARAGDGDDSSEAWAEYREFIAEASERAEVWRLETIGNAEFRALLREHPPRMAPGDEGEVVDDDDAQFGVNIDTFGKALLTFVDPEDPEIRTIAEPASEPVELARRLKRLSVGEFDELWVRAFMLNTAGVADPKASLSSPASRDTSET